MDCWLSVPWAVHFAMLSFYDDCFQMYLLASCDQCDSYYYILNRSWSFTRFDDATNYYF